RPDDLIVYGGSGKAARNWEAFDAIVRALTSLEHDETLLVQSGKPVGIFQTHPGAPRVLIVNAMLVPAWATWENFRDLEHRGLTMYGQMTAGSWIYIGSQGIVQGTYETLAEIGRRHFGGSLSGRPVVTAGLGGMCERCSNSSHEARSPSTTATISGPRRGKPAWPMRSIYAASCRSTSGRCFAREKVRSDGQRCRATPTTSAPRTMRRSICSTTTT